MKAFIKDFLIFLLQFIKNHQKEIEKLMWTIVQEIAEDVIRKRKQKTKSQGNSVRGNDNEDIDIEQSPLI